MNIRDEIVERRMKRVAAEGHHLGAHIPGERSVPVVPFLSGIPLICEVKRRSPSRGDIGEALDAAQLAGTYVGHGVSSISVLTEEDHFHGSLTDLMSVKSAYPECSVLRKDFLTDVQDVHTSYLAGADAVLLIAAILTEDRLTRMYRAAAELGMAALVELHDAADVARCRGLKPSIIGINARDLTDFTVDLLSPLGLHDAVDWEHRAVFESGLFTREHTRFLVTSGFHAGLVGEAVVKDAVIIPELIAGLTHPDSGPESVHPRRDFWLRLARRRSGERPLVKVCGITNREDAAMAVASGADALGFVFAESPRRVTPGLVRELADISTLKVGVVVSGGRHGPLADEVGDLLANGFLDAIQFHGDETPEDCARAAYPYYRAMRPQDPAEAQSPAGYGCPRVLIDSRIGGMYGGSGHQVKPEVLAALRSKGPLWLAGGLNDGNIRELVREHRPELVDVSSGLEMKPGRKDPERVRRFFEELTRA